MADTHDPHSLYAAAQERMASAWILVKGPDFVLAVYAAGLAVEAILQALAHLEGAAHDARHRLTLWLAKCSPVLQETVRRDAAFEWSWLDATWRNELRHHSTDQWLGAARKHSRWRTLKGNDDDRLREHTRRIIRSAEIIFGKALSEWRRKTTRSVLSGTVCVKWTTGYSSSPARVE